MNDFRHDSFIYGEHIDHKICDNIWKYFQDNPDKHEMGSV